MPRRGTSFLDSPVSSTCWLSTAKLVTTQHSKARSHVYTTWQFSSGTVSIVDLAAFMRLTSTRLHDNGGRAYPLPSNSHLIGSCTGLLAAAAVSCCRTVGELLPVAVEAVLVAFRCGLCAFEAAERLEPRGEAPASWSALIPQVRDNDVRNAIDKFTHDKVTQDPTAD